LPPTRTSHSSRTTVDVQIATVSWYHQILRQDAGNEALDLIGKNAAITTTAAMSEAI
jgi:hypothetical protein